VLSDQYSVLEYSAIMKNSGKPHQIVIDFENITEKLFSELLSVYGFKEEEKLLFADTAIIFFRQSNQYIHVDLNAHFRDGPATVDISIGIGPSKEWEWGSLTLGEYANYMGVGGITIGYTIKDYPNIESCISAMKNDFEKTAKDFLKGEFLSVIKSISERAKKLQPFTIYKPTDLGHYKGQPDTQSLERINYYKNLYTETTRNKNNSGTE
jgi:hypothetical protein